MILIIAEKPQVASAIADAIGNAKRMQGYIQCNEFYITWCVGHLLEIKFPEENKKWAWENFPIKSDRWQFVVNGKTKEQYEIVVDLLSKADTIINAGDPDDEGQLIVDSILYKNGIIDLKGNSQKVVKRLLINDFNTEVIAKQLQVLKNNNDYLSLSLAAIARKLADMVFGFNLTQGYTLKNNELGNDNLITVGRVQTPMLALIVRRDEEVKNHVKSKYYELAMQVNINDKYHIFKYQPKENELENNKIVDKNLADEIKARLENNINNTIIKSYEKKIEIENPPLPYNLLDLQVDCSKKYKMKADKVMTITQSLREKHKAITYNRSDCNYLLDETYNEAPALISMLQNINNTELNQYIDEADITIKSKAFDSSKTTAHTAIIPTNTQIDINKFSEEEKNVYLLISKRFIQQFLPPAKYESHTIIILAGEDILKYQKRNLIEPGYKKIGHSNDENETIENITYDIKENEVISSDNIVVQISELETKPKKLYTMDTFLNDLKRVAIYCKDEKIKQILKDKDKDKAGESGGIGTPATRSEIIKKLYDKGYIKDEKNSVVSTELGKQLISSLSDTITYPDMTALWHEKIKEINTSMDELYKFVTEVTEFSEEEINKLKNKDLNFNSNAIQCPECKQGFLKKKKNQKNNTFFWGCSNYPNCNALFQDKAGKPDIYEKQECFSCKQKTLKKINYAKGVFWKCENESCNATFSDKNSKPVEKEDNLKPSDKYKCLECNSPLIKRKGQYGYFWGCSDYPNCKTKYKDNNGEPLYNK